MTEKSALCCVISISREAYKLIYGGAEINPAALDLLSNALSHAGKHRAPAEKPYAPAEARTEARRRRAFLQGAALFLAAFFGGEF